MHTYIRTNNQHRLDKTIIRLLLGLACVFVCLAFESEVAVLLLLLLLMVYVVLQGYEGVGCAE